MIPGNYISRAIDELATKGTLFEGDAYNAPVPYLPFDEIYGLASKIFREENEV